MVSDDCTCDSTGLDPECPKHGQDAVIAPEDWSDPIEPWMDPS